MHINFFGENLQGILRSWDHHKFGKGSLCQEQIPTLFKTSKHWLNKGQESVMQGSDSFLESDFSFLHSFWGSLGTMEVSKNKFLVHLYNFHINDYQISMEENKRAWNWPSK